MSSKIREAAGSPITKVFDTVSVESSAAICAEAFGPSGGFYCALLGIECPRADVKSTYFLGYDIFGDPYIFEGTFHEAKPDAFEFGVKWNNTAEKLWNEGKWKPHPQRVGPNGLQGVLEGLDEMRKELVSGQKLVYRVDETVWPQVE